MKGCNVENVRRSASIAPGDTHLQNRRFQITMCCLFTETVDTGETATVKSNEQNH